MTYELTIEDKVPIIKNWLGREGLQLINTFTNSDKETCKTAEGLISLLGEKFKPLCNETILSLQYCKLKNIRSLASSGWANCKLRPQTFNIKNMIEG